jgi:hypothetical protein
MTSPSQISINGWTGDGADPGTEAFWRRVRADLDVEFPNGYSYDDDDAVRRFATARFEIHLHSWHMARMHNTVLPATLRYAALDREARAAVARVDGLYADLSKNTTINWLAAHHRFVLATIEARRVLTARAEAAQDLHTKHAADFTTSRRSLEIYEQHVHAAQRITIPDPDAARLDLTAFIETSTERFGILRATVTGGYPDGFAPAPAEPATAAPPADRGESDWSGAAWSASVAVANTARGW